MKKFSLLIICIIISQSIFAQQKIDDRNEKKILFIGNSLTYYNDIPSMVSYLYKAINKNVDVETELIAQGGYSLAQHLELPLSKSAIESGEYSTVVIQDFGGWPMCSPKIPACSKTSQPLKEMINIIKSSGARPIWFSTYQKHPEMQKMLSDKSEKIALELQVDMADVGKALQQYIKMDKNHSLFLSDGHLSEVGSWIAAASIVKMIIKQDILENIYLDKVCINVWQGADLKAEKLAVDQFPLKVNCVLISIENLNKIILAVNNS